MNALHWLLGAMLLAAGASLLGRPDVTIVGGHEPAAWPHEFDGEPLERIALTEQQSRFLGSFPGQLARFTDGRRDILFRQVTAPTRLLHPAEDCYRGWGYAVEAPRIRADAGGSRWRCFTASRDGMRREVCEQIRDADGRFFTDVSSWYWAASLKRSRGPWRVTLVAEPPRPQP